MTAAALKSAFDAGPQWVAGFMSGTSLDGVDVALVRTEGDSVAEFGPWETVAYGASQRAALEAATDDARAWGWSGPRPASFADAARIMTEAHVEALAALLGKPGLPQPVLVGFHGQTVLHRAPQAVMRGDSLQLADAKMMAEVLNLPVVHDFRSNDLKLGGQGAPIAPAYHAALLAKQKPKGSSVVLNIGGVANITIRNNDGTITACDVGPGNGPIDEWVAQHGAGKYDDGGRIAAAGKVRRDRMAIWSRHPFFQAPPPKSLDRCDFSARLAEGLSLEDGAATLTAFTAANIFAAIDRLAARAELVVVAGGGRLNPVLMGYLRDGLGERLKTADEIGWRGDALEAEAMAFLAARSVRELPITFPATTGVKAPATGGVLALP
jgi:anhydro-N-acetylmuramic acid kinase